MSSWTATLATDLPELALSAQRFSHPCGLVHWHLGNDDAHRGCVIAVRTPPTDSSGLPHVLEHVATCGSRRFPVRDPFFAMLRRSLQTFMNAMTYGEFTAYPFATQAPRDFANLLAVYTDLVFAPRLDDRDLAQEGHRLEPADGARWRRTGVVYHEMQGALDGSAALVDRALSAGLLPDTCWAHDSGGDPSEIPSLTADGLRAFHRRCYRPANAVVCTYGAVDPAEIHAALEPYLSDPGVALPAPSPQPPWTGPRRIDLAVPWGEDAELADASLAGIHWLWGDLANLDEALAAELVDRLLVGHAGSPLRLALESSGLGRSIAGTGLHGGARSALFSAELEGIAPGDLHALETLVQATITQVAATGLPPAETAAALHQLELSRREVGGDHLPFGLELCLRLVPPWAWGVDPLPFLDQAPAIARLAAAAQDPGWLPAQVQRRLIANPAQALVVARPDRRFAQRMAHAAAAAADQAAADAGDAGRTALRQSAADLVAWQARADDAHLLPDLDLAEVPARRPWAVGAPHGGTTVFTTRTNGLLHQVIALPLGAVCSPDFPNVTGADLDLLPLFAMAVGQVGLASGDGQPAEDYAAFASRLAGTCAGVSAWTELVCDPADPGLVRAWLLVESRGLATRRSGFLELPEQVVERLRCDEDDRWAELVDQEVARMRSRITGSGSGLAARAAMRGQSGAAGLAHRLAGFGRLAWLEDLAQRLTEEPDCLRAPMAALRDRLAALPRRRAAIADAASWRQTPVSMLAAPAADAAPGDRFRRAASPAPPATAFTTAAAVNHTALVFTGPPAIHPDAAALAVGCRLLANVELHTRIRERGGAYGAQAAWSAGTATITLSSYRDPRLDGTFADLRSGLVWLADCPDDARLLKESKLGIIAGLDAPGSPAGEARSRFIADLTGHGPAVADPLREQVLAATVADLRAAAHRWLPPGGGTAACVTSPDAAAASGLGWTIETI